MPEQKPFQLEIDGFTWIRDGSVPSNHKLKRLSEEPLYEIEAAAAMSTLAGTHGRSDLLDHPRYSTDYWRGDALVAAFLLHARALDEFFYKDLLLIEEAKRKGEERLPFRRCLTAFDFVDPPEAWATERPDRHPETQTAWGRINRTIMHLDHRRARDGYGPDEHVGSQKEQHWRVQDIWGALRPPIGAFKSIAVDARLCDGFWYRVDEALRGKAVDWGASDR